MWIDRRWRLVVMSASLLLNVFLVGTVAGHFWANRAAHHPRRGELPVVPLVNLRHLAADQRHVFQSTLAPHRPAIRAARKEQRRLKMIAEADIAAVEFDPAKVSADLAAMREAATAVQLAANTALIEALGKLTPQARANLVNNEYRDASPGK